MKQAQLLITWDFDSPLGQLNSQLPYNYSFEALKREMVMVEHIRKSALERRVNMVFATLGFTAEEGVPPFENRQQLQQLSADGFEIASHSWKHEWTPFLTNIQFKKSLKRAKESLTTVLSGEQNEILGFIPPFSRPMTWLSKGRFSWSDRTIWPLFPNANMDHVLKQLKNENYGWCRVPYHPLWKGRPRYAPHRGLSWKQPFKQHGIVCIPHHARGFDVAEMNGLMKAIENGYVYVVSGHPNMLSRTGPESMDKFDRFMDFVAEQQAKGRLTTVTGIDLMHSHG